MSWSSAKIRTIGLTLFLSGAAIFTLAMGLANPDASTGEERTTSTVSSDVVLSRGYTQTAVPGHAVVYTHVITNTGTEPDQLSLTASSTKDWVVALLDGPQNNTLTIKLAEGASATFDIRTTIPDDVLSGTVAHTVITATSSNSPTHQAIVTDKTVAYRVPSVALSPGRSRSAASGEHVTISHRVTNTGPLTDSFAIGARSQKGWAVELRGSRSVPTGPLQITLGELDSYHFVVDVAVPTESLSGLVDRVTITTASLSNNQVRETISDTITVESSRSYTSFLPCVTKHGPPPVDLGADFGLVIRERDVITYDLPLVKAMGADWVRVPLVWYEVEETPGDYDWNTYDLIFDRLRELDLKAAVVVHAAPLWAAEESCGPISDTLALERFLEETVTRYADVTEVWEFINEPDGKEPQTQYAQGAMGCWGPYPDEYARQLGIFHARIRDLDPESLVSFGGLAYDAWDRFERSFFSRTLQAGAGQFFDIANLHYYPINPEDFPTMSHKISEIQDTMRSNGVFNKKVWVTETGMWVNRRGSLEQQRDFIVREFSRGFGAGADAIFWFDLREHPVGDGVHRWLISEDHEPINGYDTFQHYASRLEGLHCKGPYKRVPDEVEAYEFSQSGRSLYILWSETSTQTVSIPMSVDAFLTDRDGTMTETLSAENGKINFDLGTQPVFLEAIQEGP